jgi:hypothetical protein
MEEVCRKKKLNSKINNDFSIIHVKNIKRLYKSHLDSCVLEEKIPRQGLAEAESPPAVDPTRREGRHGWLQDTPPATLTNRGPSSRSAPLTNPRGRRAWRRSWRKRAGWHECRLQAAAMARPARWGDQLADVGRGGWGVIWKLIRNGLQKIRLEIASCQPWLIGVLFYRWLMGVLDGGSYSLRPQISVRARFSRYIMKWSKKCIGKVHLPSLISSPPMS